MYFSHIHQKRRLDLENQPPLSLCKDSLGDLAKGDDREDHREDGHRLDDAERAEVVGKTLSRLALRVTRGRRGTSLEESRKADAEPREDAENDTGDPRALNAALAEHDEHEDHAVQRLRDRRADKAEEDERRRLVRRIALLPRANRSRSCNARTEGCTRRPEI